MAPEIIRIKKTAVVPKEGNYNNKVDVCLFVCLFVLMVCMYLCWRP